MNKSKQIIPSFCSQLVNTLWIHYSK